MTATYIVGDSRATAERLAREGRRFDLAICSPPFLALRSYLPDSHPAKADEMGSEATPAAFIDALLWWVAAIGELLERHGSLVVELGDTYAGSGGAGGDYNPGGLRDGQNAFTGSGLRTRDDTKYRRVHDAEAGPPIPNLNDKRQGGGPGWPLDKSLCGIPQAFMLSLIYGYNVLDRRGPDSPAGRWRVRNLKPWIRSNPPVGALGDKERPATSYVVVATRAPDRYFDLDAVRTAPAPANRRTAKGVDQVARTGKSADRGGNWRSLPEQAESAGAPPLDWWHHADAVIDAELDRRAGKAASNARTANGVDQRATTGKAAADERRGGNWSTLPTQHRTAGAVGARGVHIRRALERAGILATLDALDVSPKGYSGAHYAVWPPELVRLLIDEMCPRRVCTTCGEPSRRITSAPEYVGDDGGTLPTDAEWSAGRTLTEDGWTPKRGHMTRRTATVGWSDCGHDTWRPGRILDPFVGSGTTLAVASGMGRDSVGVDINYANVGLAYERVGPLLLDVVWPEPDLTLRQLGAGCPHPASYRRWERITGSLGAAGRGILARPRDGRVDDEQGCDIVTRDPAPERRPKVSRRGTPPVLVGQGTMFDHPA